MAEHHNQEMRRILIELSGQSNTIAIPRLYIDFMDGLAGGAFLSQLIYWSDRGGRSDGWFWKTYEEWGEEICVSESKIRGLVATLKETGIIETKVKKANGNPTVHYKLNWEKFTEHLIRFVKSTDGNRKKTGTKETVKKREPNRKKTGTITKITSETTTESLASDDAGHEFENALNGKPNNRRKATSGFGLDQLDEFDRKQGMRIQQALAAQGKSHDATMLAETHAKSVHQLRTGKNPVAENRIVVVVDFLQNNYVDKHTPKIRKRDGFRDLFGRFEEAIDRMRDGNSGILSIPKDRVDIYRQVYCTVREEVEWIDGMEQDAVDRELSKHGLNPGCVSPDELIQMNAEGWQQ